MPNNDNDMDPGMIADDESHNDSALTPEPMPPIATPQPTQPTSATPKQEALRGLPPEWRERLVEQAAAMGIRSDGDIAWLLVKSFINAWAGAAAAGDRLVEIQSASGKIGQMIFDQTSAAGRDLNQAVATTIQKKMTEAGGALSKTIQTAATHGASALQAAAINLDKMGQEKGAEFIEAWKTAASRAIGVQSRLAIKKAWAWALTTILIATILWAGIGIGGAWYFRRLTPSDLHIYSLPDGTFAEVFPGDTRVNRDMHCPKSHLCLQVFPNAQ